MSGCDYTEDLSVEQPAIKLFTALGGQTMLGEVIFPPRLLSGRIDP
jgi:hypothetical protein